MNKTIIVPSGSVSYPLTGGLAICALPQFIEAMLGGVTSDPLRCAGERELRIITSRTRREKESAASDLGTVSDGVVMCHHASYVFWGSDIPYYIKGARRAGRSGLPACERGGKSGPHKRINAQRTYGATDIPARQYMGRLEAGPPSAPSPGKYRRTVA